MTLIDLTQRRRPVPVERLPRDDSAEIAAETAAMQAAAEIAAEASALAEEARQERFQRQAPAAEIERRIDHHRRDAAECDEKAAETRKALAARKAVIEAQVEVERKRHRDEIERLAALADAAEAKARRDLEALERLAAYHRGGVDALEAQPLEGRADG